LDRVDSRDRKDHREPRVTRVFREPRGPRELLDRLDLLEILANLEPLEQADYLATPDSRGQSVRRDPLGHRGKPEHRDNRASPGRRASRATLDTLERLGQREPLAARDLWDNRVLLELRARLDPLEPPEHREIVDHRVVPDPRDPLGNPDHKVQLDSLARLALRVTAVRPVLPGQRVHLVSRVPRVSRVKLEVRVTVV